MWDHKEPTLVMNNKFTEVGMSAYWQAVDASAKFNVTHREIYMSKKLRSEVEPSESSKEMAKPKLNTADPMNDFFRRRRMHDFERRDSAAEHRNRESNRRDYVSDHRRYDREEDYAEYYVGACMAPREDEYQQRRRLDRFILPRPKMRF